MLEQLFPFENCQNSNCTSHHQLKVVALLGPELSARGPPFAQTPHARSPSVFLPRPSPGTQRHAWRSAAADVPTQILETLCGGGGGRGRHGQCGVPHAQGPVHVAGIRRQRLGLSLETACHRRSGRLPVMYTAPRRLLTSRYFSLAEVIISTRDLVMAVPPYTAVAVKNCYQRGSLQ